MLGWILLAVYVIGIPIWMWVEKKFFPFEEGEYRIEFDGPHEVTPELWQIEVISRSFMWPIVLAFIIIIFPMRLADKLFEKI